ncbi:hypothetical protein NDK47_10545 [Brevibacillus ruminantium]|uniref:Uncharacterized protein n=1 Tax=Brevibacillus ruminantium TaxID=2950604 RepID=A0ABY4WKK6_9BACL|nr:hypothetical protein [Brevibacillus ruminantium]USG67680.1 hypothetical protein NDK47_10545 [Brevibacillus ruminantium]
MSSHLQVTSFLQTTNRIGTEEETFFFGESAAADPFGRLLVLGDQCESGYLIHFDLEKIREARGMPHYLRHRRPASYVPLAESREENAAEICSS